MLHRFDQKIILMIQKLPAWVRVFMVFASNAGHPYVTISIGVVLVGLRLNGSVTDAGVLILLAILLSSLLKLVLRRKRPVTYVTKSLVVTFSFPSGHTVGATVAYGVLAMLSASAFSGFIALIAVLALIFLIVVVGVSRVYLGAHYPSDVVAGWILGIMSLAVILLGIQPTL